jgi:hypothetical protein
MKLVLDPNLEGMVVWVAGGRSYDDRECVFAALDDLAIRLVLHGACRDRKGQLMGADRWAEEWAISREVPYVGIPAMWGLYGKAAGPHRNGILSMNDVDRLVVFPGGAGTQDAIRRAESHCIPVFRVGWEEE